MVICHTCANGLVLLEWAVLDQALNWETSGW